MTTDDKINVKNDWLMAGILSTLVKQNSETTTSKLKTETGADSTHLISYRLDKLESAGYVQTGQMSMEDWDSPGIPPRTASLTREGREFADECDLEGWDEPDTIARRIGRLENKVEQQDDLIQKLLVATGIEQESPLPSVVEVRAAYPAIQSAFDSQDIEVNEHVPKWAADKAREIKG